MNYRHTYHAGNFSDVFKHLVLFELIAYLQQKTTPLFYLETHAGRGFYDLHREEAQKTQEYQNGILKLLNQENVPPVIQQYTKWIKTFNPQRLKDHELRYFPGSPLLIHSQLRAQDRLVLSELHPEEYVVLKELFNRKSPQPTIQHMDGYLALKAFLPPKERRGLVFIDPPYEKLEELQLLLDALKLALKKWPQGMYAIWYPIKDKAYTQKIKKAFAELPGEKNLDLELRVLPDLPFRLNGCGMWIINPPWQLENKLADWFGWLERRLSLV